MTLPGVTLHLDYRAENGHSHSKGDTTIYFEEEEVFIAGDLLYTEVHPVTFFGNIPNWLTSLKPLFESHYQQLVPGHGPAVDGEQAGRTYFKKHARLPGRLLRPSRGNRIRAAKAAKRSLNTCQAALTRGSARPEWCERNINQFLTGKWF